MEASIHTIRNASLSIIVVSDYAAGGNKSWEDLRRALRAWANQRENPAEEFLLVESSQFRGEVPRDVADFILARALVSERHQVEVVH